jgi:hypothetical protein
VGINEEVGARGVSEEGCGTGEKEDRVPEGGQRVQQQQQSAPEEPECATHRERQQKPLVRES